MDGSRSLSGGGSIQGRLVVPADAWDPGENCDREVRKDTDRWRAIPPNPSITQNSPLPDQRSRKRTVSRSLRRIRAKCANPDAQQAFIDGRLAPKRHGTESQSILNQKQISGIV